MHFIVICGLSKKIQLHNISDFQQCLPGEEGRSRSFAHVSVLNLYSPISSPQAGHLPTAGTTLASYINTPVRACLQGGRVTLANRLP